MKYFDRNMNVNEMRKRYFDLVLFNPVPAAELPEVEREHEEMIDMTIKHENEMFLAGWMTE